jgi:hypothetical protein
MEINYFFSGVCFVLFIIVCFVLFIGVCLSKNFNAMEFDAISLFFNNTHFGIPCFNASFLSLQHGIPFPSNISHDVIEFDGLNAILPILNTNVICVIILLFIVWYCKLFLFQFLYIMKN